MKSHGVQSACIASTSACIAPMGMVYWDTVSEPARTKMRFSCR